MSTKHVVRTDLERLAALDDSLLGDQDLARISRSQRKRENEGLRQLGTDLVALSAGRLAKLDLPAELRQAVDEARRLAVHGARRRQIQFIARLLEQCDEEAIRAAIQAIDHSTGSPGPAPKASQVQSAAAITAMALLEGDEATIFQVASGYLPSDAQPLRQAVRKARKARATGGSTTAACRDIESCLSRLTLR